jgi:hypothetical protein
VCQREIPPETCKGCSDCAIDADDGEPAIEFAYAHDFDSAAAVCNLVTA